MKLAVVDWLERLRASYWVLPAAMAALAAVLAVVTVRIDESYGTEWVRSLPGIHVVRADGARSVLSAIAASMIGVAGVTFSMTIVSVSFATAQYGPRLIGNFMRDRSNQVTLGTFIATFVYCLMVLSTVTSEVSGPDGVVHPASVPSFSVFVAIAMALASVGVLIYFIHHVPESINIGRITARIGNDLCAAVRETFGGELGRTGRDGEGERLSRGEVGAQWRGGDPIVVRAERAGYVQSIDEDALLELASEAGLGVHLLLRPGSFVLAGSRVMELHGARELESAAQARFRACCSIGRERTPRQNLLYLTDLLVEILGRAMSPGVNDPFTAQSCLGWLANGLAEASTRASPASARHDEGGVLRLRSHPVTFELLVSAVFDQSRQYVAGDRITALYAQRMIAEVHAACPTEERKALLLARADRLVAAAGEMMPSREAREELRRRHELAHARAAGDDLDRVMRDAADETGESA